MVYVNEMDSERWVETSIVRSDGKREFRERPKYGNRHVIFQSNSKWGEVHVDKYNALNFPIGTIDHLSKYTEEKTGIPEPVAKGVIILGGLIVCIKALQCLRDNN